MILGIYSNSIIPIEFGHGAHQRKAKKLNVKIDTSWTYINNKTSKEFGLKYLLNPWLKLPISFMFYYTTPGNKSIQCLTWVSFVFNQTMY